MACGGDAQRGRRCGTIDDAVGFFVNSRMLWLLMCCCQSAYRLLSQRTRNRSKQRPSTMIVDHD